MPARKAAGAGPITRDEVVAAALAVARRDGVAGLSMRALADELDATTMAAYHWVGSKAELLALVAEQVLAGIATPTEGDWADRFAEMQRRIHAALLHYPGLSTYLLDNPAPPDATAKVAAGVAILREGGFDAAEARLVALTAEAYLLGRISVEISRRQHPDHPLASTGDGSEFEYGLQLMVAGLRARRPRRRRR